MSSPTQVQLSAFIRRRHPSYNALIKHWNFLAACYAGGRAWFVGNIFQYLKEGDQEFKDRIERAYRFNHTREIVDLVSKYIFKAPISRNADDASPAVQSFWALPTLSSVDMDHFSRQISDKTSIYGRIWIVVDSTSSGLAKTKAEEAKEGARVYAYIVSPQNALDMSFDDMGKLNWILIREEYRDDSDPVLGTGTVHERFRLWTRNEWILYEYENPGTSVKPVGKGTAKTKIKETDRREHGLGIVPVIKADHISTDEDKYSSPSLVGDIAYLDRATANYLSNLDAIIQDQTFSQLAMPAQGVLPGDEKYDALREVGTKRIFLFDGEYGSAPFFLSPDPRQATMIVTAIKQIINEIYHTVGMAGERTKQDNAVGIDNSSGVAKAFDFERVNALLKSKASILQSIELQILDLVMRWSGEEGSAEDLSLISYPDTFDVRGLFDEFAIAEQLDLVQAPDKSRRKQMKQLIKKLFPEAGKSEIAELEGELIDWPPQPETVAEPKSLFGDKESDANA